MNAPANSLRIRTEDMICCANQSEEIGVVELVIGAE